MIEDYSEAALLRRAREANEQWDKAWQEHMAAREAMLAEFMKRKEDAGRGEPKRLPPKRTYVD